MDKGVHRERNGAFFISFVWHAFLSYVHLQRVRRASYTKLCGLRATEASRRSMTATQNCPVCEQQRLHDVQWLHDVVCNSEERVMVQTLRVVNISLTRSFTTSSMIFFLVQCSMKSSNAWLVFESRSNGRGVIRTSKRSSALERRTGFE